MTELVELRRYRLHPGAREDLIALFERVLIEGQEAAGMEVLGQFRDADEPDHFVWLRGFPSDSPDERAAALERFYGGPVWAEHRDAANATMVDSDDVLLLRPLGELAPASRGPVLATVCLLGASPGERLGEAASELAGAPGLIGILATAGVPNRYPQLPVRDEHAVVWLQTAEEPAPVPAALREHRAGEPLVSRLLPTSA